MSSRAESEKQKLIQEKCQVILGNLLREEDNKYCVDCDAKGPRWASWNLGIFLCIRCAGIHRNLGVHISKVKSVNLDTWTPEQVACLQQMGNSQARAVYEANLPDNFRRPQTDSSLEAFVRAKYETKKYIAKEWVPPPPPKPAFDIEEEKRREREKRKSRTKVAANAEISPLPQLPASLPRLPAALPRPHSAGPSIKNVFPEPSTTTPAVQVPISPDLLCLGDSNTTNHGLLDTFPDHFDFPVTSESERDSGYSASLDPFNSSASLDPFSSATTSNPFSSSKPSDAFSSDNFLFENSLKDEEENFFNQTFTADTVQGNRMTKESILSLYGSNASQTLAPPPVPPVYGIPGGMYVRPPVYAQVGVGGYPSVPTSGINNSIPGANTSAIYNPFTALGQSPVVQDPRHPNMWIGLAPGSRDDPVMTSHGLGQVQQQMASLQLSSQAWNVAPVNATGVIIGTNQPGAGIVWPATTNGQGLSNNFWQ